MVRITGTLIWYYYICPREVWLMAHEINPFQDNAFLELGRFMGKETYKREKKEIDIGHMKIDLIKKTNGSLVVGEIKKSSRFVNASTMQLLFYLYQLRQKGIKAKGELLIPKERKKIPIELTEDKEKELKKAFVDIKEILKMESPPPPERIPFCRNCAYNEFCWA